MASSEVITSHKPSVAQMMKSSSGSAEMDLMSGVQLTKGRRSRSPTPILLPYPILKTFVDNVPNDRATAKTPLILYTPVEGIGEWFFPTSPCQRTLPPRDVIRLLSSAFSGLWSEVRATALPARDNTARESPGKSPREPKEKWELHTEIHRSVGMGPELSPIPIDDYHTRS